MQINTFLVYLSLTLVGLCLGSFAGASVWRLRARQLKEDKDAGEKVDKNEYDQLQDLANVSLAGDRSRCLHCNYVLHWYDLIPLVSWLVLKGRCRKCKKPIGYLEPLIELGVAAFFVASYAWWPYSLSGELEVVRFIVWLIAGVGLAILFAYDTLWSLLPDQVSFTVVALGVINSSLVMLSADDKLVSILSLGGAIMILSGFYFLIYLVSSGRWIGFGDVKLGLGLALLLTDWRLAFLALFSANLIGCLIVIPAMLSGKLRRDSHVPFGPLLIAGYIIAALYGNYLLGIYLYTLV